MAQWPVAAVSSGVDDIGTYNRRFGSTPLGYDYEFDSVDTTSIPSGWSWGNQGDSTYREIAGQGRLWGAPTGGTTASEETHRMLLRGRPSESSWDAVVKLTHMSEQGNWSRAGVCLRNSSGGNYVLAGRALGGSDLGKCQLNLWSGFGSFSSEPVQRSFSFVPTYFRVIQYSTTSMDFLMSADGVTFYGLYFGFDPSSESYDQIGFYTGLRTDSYDWSVASASWFRVR